MYLSEELRRGRDLNWTAKGALMFLAEAVPRGHEFGHRRLAEELGVSVNAATRALHSLTNAGLVLVELADGKRSRYRLTPKGEALTHGGEHV